jgi:hypothetical protein
MNTTAKRMAVGWRLAVLAVGLLGLISAPVYKGGRVWHWLPDAVAAEAGHGGGHSGGKGAGHGGAHEGAGGDHGDEHGDGHTPGPKGQGQGAGRGGRQHETARGGGKAVEDKVLSGRRPVWAREGIPEVELGRLNVARAPGQVLARAEGEALATYRQPMRVIYSLSAAEAAALLASNYRDVARFDSPVQNLALYRDLMTFGDTQLREVDPELVPASRLDLAAIFLGSASDKTIPVSEDTVTAVNRILGLAEMDPADRAVLAGKAETVRQAILAGHGPAEDH